MPGRYWYFLVWPRAIARGKKRNAQVASSSLSKCHVYSGMRGVLGIRDFSPSGSVPDLLKFDPEVRLIDR